MYHRQFVHCITVHSADDLCDKQYSAKFILISECTYSELDSKYNIKIICARLNAHFNAKWRKMFVFRTVVVVYPLP